MKNKVLLRAVGVIFLFSACTSATKTAEGEPAAPPASSGDFLSLKVAPVWPYDTQPVSPSVVAAFQRKIQHIVVIYQENWSFDSLYGKFPGAEGISYASLESLLQRNKNGVLLTKAPVPTRGGEPDLDFAQADLSAFLKPYDLAQYKKTSSLTGNLDPQFYTSQLQIDGGKNDKFVAWSDNGGLAMSYYDATDLPEGRLARQYVLFDHFFTAAFGGAFLNHQFLVAARAPVFQKAPVEMISTPPDNLGLTATDKSVAPDGYLVNAAFSVNHPIPPWITNTLNLVPNQTYPTIGDSLSARGVTWAWFSGGWNDALAGHPDPFFQYQNQPFQYFANYADNTERKSLHLKDEKDFLSALTERTLPAVSFLEPLPENSEHPGYSSLIQGQKHVADLVAKIQASPYWEQTAIFLLYDDSGGRWDHVSPPVVDRWGPGSRVPAILISPYAKREWIEHRPYDATAILKLIETRWDLPSLSDRDATADDLLHAFEF